MTFFLSIQCSKWFDKIYNQFFYIFLTPVILMSVHSKNINVTKINQKTFCALAQELHNSIVLKKQKKTDTIFGSK